MQGEGHRERGQSTVTFYEWLAEQAGRDDPIGDLAGDTMRDDGCPKTSSDFEKWDDYLQSRRVSSEVVDTFREAFVEYAKFDTDYWCALDDANP